MPTSATSFSTGLILCATSFSLGVLYSNWGYDYHTLWVSTPTVESFARSLEHYKVWATMPKFLYHVHHVVIGLGFLGLFVKLYKPSESNKLFDGGSLFLYVIGLAVYLTNLRKGARAVVDGEWGEVDQATGINVIAASQVMIVLILMGVAGLQLGQYWAEWEDQKVVEQAKKQEQEEKAAAKDTSGNEKKGKNGGKNNSKKNK